MTIKHWSLRVYEEGIITFPDDFLEVTGWKPDTKLQWDINDDGSISLTEVKEPDSGKAQPES